VIDEKKLFQQIGARIRERRDEVGLTQSELAQQLGLERTSITNIELGNQKTSVQVLYRICLSLKISIENLLPPLQDVTGGPRETGVEVTVGKRTEPQVPAKTAALIKRLART